MLLYKLLVFGAAAFALVAGKTPQRLADGGKDYVFVVGFPKSGTTSLQRFFTCGRRAACHWACDVLGQQQSSRIVGQCIHDNIAAKTDPLRDCGNYTVWTQMDYAWYMKPDKTDFECYFPQRDALRELHLYYPRATFVLNTRNSKSWLSSVTRWIDLKQRMKLCFGIRTDAELVSLYEKHIQTIFQFIQTHRSHPFIQIDIESPFAGTQLHKHFPDIPTSCWKLENNNPTKAPPPPPPSPPPRTRQPSRGAPTRKARH